METAVLLSFAVVAATLIIVPGPDWALILSASSPSGTSRGSGNVVPVVSGLAIGYTIVTAVVVMGVAPLVAAIPAALLMLTLVGGAYLIYVGTGILRRPSELAMPDGSMGVVGPGGAVKQGVGVSALNPKALLFFLAFLPQFTRADAPWPMPAQLAVLGGIWILLAVGFYLMLGFGVQRVLAVRPQMARTISRVAGATMVLFGVALLGELLWRTVAGH